MIIIILSHRSIIISLSLRGNPRTRCQYFFKILSGKSIVLIEPIFLKCGAYSIGSILNSLPLLNDTELLLPLFRYRLFAHQSQHFLLLLVARVHILLVTWISLVFLSFVGEFLYNFLLLLIKLHEHLVLEDLHSQLLSLLILVQVEVAAEVLKRMVDIAFYEVVLRLELVSAL